MFFFFSDVPEFAKREKSLYQNSCDAKGAWTGEQVARDAGESLA